MGVLLLSTKGASDIGAPIALKVSFVTHVIKCPTSARASEGWPAASVSPERERVDAVTSAPLAAVTEWLTIPELAEAIGETPGRVRRLLDERALIASRVDGVLRVPAAFVQDGRVLPALRGTIIVLEDAGFAGDEAIEWLFASEPTIGRAPIEALRAGHKSEVRRVAQALA